MWLRPCSQPMVVLLQVCYPSCLSLWNVHTDLLFTTRRIPPPRPLRFLGEEIRWEETVKYPGVTLDRILTWSSHIDQVRRKASRRLEVLSPLLNKHSGLSIRNGLMLYRHDGLRLPSVVTCCRQPFEEASTRSVQMLAYYCWRTFVR